MHRVWLSVAILAISSAEGIPTFAQSLLSQTWREKQIEVRSLTVNSASFYNTEAPPSASFTRLPSDLSFETVQALIPVNPEQAWADLEKIRPNLPAEKSLWLEIQWLVQRQEWGKIEILAEGFLRAFPHNPDFPHVYYHFQRARFEQKKLLEGTLPLQLAQIVRLPAALQSSFWQMLAEEALRQGDLIGALKAWIREKESATTLNQTPLKTIQSTLAQLTTQAELKTIEDQFGHLDWLREDLIYHKLKLWQQQGSPAEALKLLKKLLTQPQSPPFLEKLQALEYRWQILARLQPQKIGVVLPLRATSPQIANWAKEALEGIQLALYVELENSGRSAVEKNPLASFELVIRETDLDPEKNAEAVRELIEREHVIAILGPLTRQTTESAAYETQKWGIPLISFSRNSKMVFEKVAPFMSMSSYTQELQVLAHYVVDYQNVRRLCLLYTETPDSLQKMTIFGKAFIEAGGQVVAIEAWKSHSTDRKTQWKAWQADPRFQQADGAFLATSVMELGLLQVMTNDRGDSGLQHWMILGDNLWDHPSLAFYAEKVRWPFFLSMSFFRQSLAPEVQYFLKSHEEVWGMRSGYAGPSVYTSIAYDSARLLFKVINETPHPTPALLEQRLLQLSAYTGVTGKLRFSSNRQIQREIRIVGPQSGRIVSFN